MRRTGKALASKVWACIGRILTVPVYWRTVLGTVSTVIVVHGVGSWLLPEYSSFGAMLVYATVGILLVSLIDKLWIDSYDVLQELFVEKNIAVGLAVLGICIIIAAAITRS